MHLAYAYGYNSDGVKVLERKYITSQHWLEYRFVGCGADCTRNSLSLYARERVGGQDSGWRRAEEYVPFPTGLMYRVPQSENEPSFTFVLSSIGNGYVVHYPGGQMIASYHTDRDGVQVGGLALPVCAEKRDWTAGCVPYPVVPAPEMPPYVPPSVGWGDSGCGGKGAGSSPDDWCMRNKQNPSALNCQDCCDQKSLRESKICPKIYVKKLKRCIEQQCRDTDPDVRLVCFEGCLVSTLGEWKALPWLQKIRRYLECCYLECVNRGGRFDPPGRCKLPF